MKNLFVIFITIILALNAQTNNQIKKQLKDSNISPEQAKKMAKDRGYTDQQIKSEAETRGIKIDNEGNGSDFLEMTDTQIKPPIDGSTAMEIPESKTIENEVLEVVENELVLETAIDSAREAKSYFGYQIFHGDPKAFQASTFGAVNPNYNIGPGDEIIVMLWGESQFRHEFTIDREGYVFVPDVGQVFVNGLNLEMLEKKFFQTLSKVYSTLKPVTGKPTTFMDISLGNLRPLRIIVLGEVGQPGAYSVSPSTSLSSSLYYFRGPTTMGSLRDIRLLRKNKLIGSIDFYNYLLSGKEPEDIRLQLDDVVFIPPRGKTVAISGEINRPAIYELRSNEGLKDLINIAGGLRVTTYMNRAQIDRIVAPEDRDSLGMDRMMVDVNISDILNSKQDYPLQGGDTVKLFSILNTRENTVTISGAVVRPGTYDYGDGMKLRDLVLRAEGLVGNAYLERADVVRTSSDFKEELVKINIEASMIDSADQNILLQPMDHLRIYSMDELIGPKFVTIEGHVQNQGKYPHLKNMRLYDLIFLGGGLADKDWLEHTYMERADLIRQDDYNITSRVIPFNLGELLNDPQDQAKNWLLESDDIVRIYTTNIFNKTSKVSIDGSVRNPGTYFLKSNMTIKDLILESGGVVQDVYRYKIEVARIDPKNNNRNVYSKIISLDMSNDFTLSNIQYLSNSSELFVERDEFKLEPYDRISIRPDPNFSLHRTVTIRGEVNYPGTYSLTHPNEKVSDIIYRSGGLREEAYPMASILIRSGRKIRLSFDKIIDNERSKDNFELLHGDSIIISAHPNIVIMLGEINTPGNYKYYNNKTVRGYISLAGGLTVNAEMREIRVTYPDGTSKQLKRFLPSPAVKDGSVITVGMKKEEEPVNKTEFAKEIASIIADFVQIALTLVIIANTSSG